MIFNQGQNLVGINVMYAWYIGENYLHPTEVDIKNAT
jgi:hypothetical protein